MSIDAQRQIADAILFERAARAIHRRRSEGTFPGWVDRTAEDVEWMALRLRKKAEQ